VKRVLIVVIVVIGLLVPAVEASTTPPKSVLTLSEITKHANLAVKATLTEYPGAIFKVIACHTTAPRYGSCSFYVVIPASSAAQKGLQRCEGLVDIRNLGKGFEHRFLIKSCKAV
jgi:hypothetical protein